MIKSLYKYIFNKSATLLNREQLGSIELDLAGITGLSEDEIKERNATISSDFKIIELTIKRLLIAQQEFMANQCENEKQLLFGRGSSNGISLVLEEFKKYKSQHDELTKPSEEFNQYKVI